MKTLIIFCILFMFTTQSEQQKFDFEFTVKCNLTLDKANELEKELLDLIKEYSGSLSIEITKPVNPKYNLWDYYPTLLYDTTWNWLRGQ